MRLSPSIHAATEPGRTVARVLSNPPRPARLRRDAALLALLVGAGAAMLAGWLGVWTLSYRLTHGNDFTYSYLVTYGAVWERLYDWLVLGNALLPGLEPPQSIDILVYALVGAFGVVGAGYVVGLVLLDRGLGRWRGMVWLVVAVTVWIQVALFLMPGVYTSDIFSYIMYGRIAAVYGANPYVAPPDAFPGDPIFTWVRPFWWGQPSVYGPLWTDLSWALTRLTDSLSLTDQVLAYKLLMNASYLVDLGLVWWLLGRLRPGDGTRRARVTAFAMFAWNPLLLFEIAGNGHNDALMVTLLLLSLVPLAGRRALPGAEPRGSRAWGHRSEIATHRRWSAALVLAGLSSLVKYTSGVLVLFYAVAWARQVRRWRTGLAWMAGAALGLAGLALALAWPWLQLPQALRPLLEAAGGTLYTNSVPDLVALTVADQLLARAGLDPSAAQDAARAGMKLLTRAAFALYLVWESRRVWERAAAGRRAAIQAVLEASTRALLLVITVVLTWVLAWYFTWPLALAALLGWGSTLARVVIAYSLTALPVFYAHQYWEYLMPGSLLLAYAGLPLLVPVGEWLLRRRRVPASPLPSAGGQPAPGGGVPAYLAAGRQDRHEVPASAPWPGLPPERLQPDELERLAR